MITAYLIKDLHLKFAPFESSSRETGLDENNRIVASRCIKKERNEEQCLQMSGRRRRDACLNSVIYRQVTKNPFVYGTETIAVEADSDVMPKARFTGSLILLERDFFFYLRRNM